jgi:SAM-dependent methyltransferase
MLPTPLDPHNLDVLAHAPRYNAALISEFASLFSPGTTLGTIVDFGAGRGTLTGELRALAQTVIAIEPELSYHETLKAKCSRVLANVAELSEPVDAIFTSNVLEHILDDEGTMRSLFGALKPGGVLFVYVPALPHLFSAMDTAVGHVRRYRRLELGGKLQAAGFSLEALEYRDCIGVPASWWLKAQGAAAAHPSIGAVRFYDRWLFPLSHRLDLAGARRLAGKNLMAVAVRPRAVSP